MLANPPDGSTESHHSAGTQGRIIIERKLQNLLSRSLGEPEKEEKEKEKEEEEVDCVVWTRIYLNRPCFCPVNHQTRLRKRTKPMEFLLLHSQSPGTARSAGSL